jgi:rare lipoprotein A
MRSYFLIRRIVPFIVILLCLFACVKTKNQTQSQNQAEEELSSPRYLLDKPYQINGLWYYPAVDYQFDETGMASLYTPDHPKKRTSNGEVFDQEEVTGSHRTLPLPCLVEVTNLENGRTIKLRLNDRGPKDIGQIMSLTKRAGELLDIAPHKIVPVHVKILQDETRLLVSKIKALEGVPSLEAAPRVTVIRESISGQNGSKKQETQIKSSTSIEEKTGNEADFLTPLADQIVILHSTSPVQLYIQGGVFTQIENTRPISHGLSKFGPVSIREVRKFGKPYLGVRIGPFSSYSIAVEKLETVLKSGYPDAKIVVD